MATKTSNVTVPGCDIVIVNEVAVLVNEVEVELVGIHLHMGKTSYGTVEETTRWRAWSQGVIVIAAVSDCNVADVIDNKVLKVVLVTIHVRAHSILLHQRNQTGLQAKSFGLKIVLTSVGVNLEERKPRL